MPVTVATPAGDEIVREDEQPQTARRDRSPRLEPAFKAGGTVTAANASSISDGAAALVLSPAEMAENLTIAPHAKVVDFAAHAQEPKWFTTAPVFTVRKLLDRIGWAVGDVDLWEVNEAFAVVAMAFQQDLEIALEKLNVHGGACALGHPIGASGARILVTLLQALERIDKRRGVAAICIGGGEALAVAIER